MLCLFAEALQTAAAVKIPSGLGLFWNMGQGAAMEGSLSRVLLERVLIHPSPSPLLHLAHLVYVFVPYREGEGEAQG